MPDVPSVEALITRLGELAAEVSRAAAQDVAPELLLRAEQAVRHASERVAPGLLGGAGRRNTPAGAVLRDAAAAVEDAVRAVEELRAGLRSARGEGSDT
jgi:hypothetical protein